MKIDKKLAAKIRRRYKGRGNGPTQRQLAEQYGVSRSTIWYCLNPERWKELQARFKQNHPNYHLQYMKNKRS